MGENHFQIYLFVIGLHAALIAAETFNICPTRTVESGPSGAIRSPGYPGYHGPHDCNLTLTVPPYAIVTFTSGYSYSAQCSTDGSSYLRIVTPNVAFPVNICGRKRYLYSLHDYFSSVNESSSVTLMSKSNASSDDWYKYGIRYTVFNPIDVGFNINRTISATGPMDILSHTGWSTPYRNNIESSLTLTGVVPDKQFKITFPYGTQINLAPGCGDFIEIIGIRGYTDNRVKICGGELGRANTLLTPISDEVTFRFHTDDSGIGFQVNMFYIPHSYL